MVSVLMAKNLHRLETQSYLCANDGRPKTWAAGTDQHSWLHTLGFALWVSLQTKNHEDGCARVLVRKVCWHDLGSVVVPLHRALSAARGGKRVVHMVNGLLFRDTNLE